MSWSGVVRDSRELTEWEAGCSGHSSIGAVLTLIDTPLGPLLQDLAIPAAKPVRVQSRAIWLDGTHAI